MCVNSGLNTTRAGMDLSRFFPHAGTKRKKPESPPLPQPPPPPPAQRRPAPVLPGAFAHTAAQCPNPAACTDTTCTQPTPTVCTWPGCTYVIAGKKKQRITLHMRTHTGEKPYVCDWPDCNYNAGQKVHLKSHIRTHTGEKPYACDWPGCTLRCSFKSSLKVHTRTHTGEKPYLCEWPDCTYKCITASGLRTHKQTHTGEKPYMCDWPGCTFKIRVNEKLKQHKRTHTGEKPCVCDWPDCKYRCTSGNGLRMHKRTHTGEKPYVCDWTGCTYKSTQWSNLQCHNRTHTGEKPYECPDPNCDYRSKTSTSTKKHFNAWHTAEACQRQKKAEQAVQKALDAARLVFERETRINYGCGLTVDKYWANIDFVLYLHDRVILLEVDERQHDGYGVGCDAARMSHVHSALIAENADRAVMFVRFNPDAYRIDGRLVSILKRDRHRKLVEFLRQLQKARTRGAMAAGQLSIQYLYYDQKTASNGFERELLVLQDAEYPDGLKTCVQPPVDC